MNNDIKQVQKMINDSDNIVFFGGAGVSTASGIPDFRSEDGLYNGKHNFKYPPEIMLSTNFFEKKPKEFFEFYKDTMCVLGYKPNSVHYKLAELEKIGKLKAVITQNVDGLHQAAGSQKVIELHGTIHDNTCIKCGKKFTAEYVKNSKGIPLCDECNDKDAFVNPGITLYGETLPFGAFEEASNYVANADMLIVAGTSLNVYPAASLLNKFSGKYLIIINKQETNRDKRATLVIHDDMVEVFNQLKF